MLIVVCDKDQSLYTNQYFYLLKTLLYCKVYKNRNKVPVATITHYLSISFQNKPLYCKIAY